LLRNRQGVFVFIDFRIFKDVNLVNTSNRFYNYVYCDPRKRILYKIPGIDIILPAQPFYVGRGEGDRKTAHLWESFSETYKKNSHKQNTIRAIINEGLEPIIIQLNNGLSNNVANQSEKYLVKVIGRADLKRGPLTNLTNGGETSAGYKMPKESIEKSLATKLKNGTWSTGFKGKHTDEAKEKNRIKHLGKPSGMLGKKCTPDQIERNRQSHLGKKQSDETKEKLRQIILAKKKGYKLFEFDLKGNKINEFDSSLLAGKFYSIDPVAINNNARGKTNSCNKSIWIREKDFSEELLFKLVTLNADKSVWNKGKSIPAPHFEKSVAQLNPKTFEIIEVFKSLSSAAKKFDVSPSAIGNSIRRDGLCKKFKWSYYE